MNTAKMLSDVAEFMTAFKQLFPAVNPERDKWLEEEARELREGASPVDELDAIVDYAYILCGKALEQGKDLDNYPAPMACIEMYLYKYDAVFDRAWDIIHKCNMAKLWTVRDLVNVEKSNDLTCESAGIGPGFIVKRNGKVVKPPGWVGPEDALRALLEENKTQTQNTQTT